MNDHVQGPRGIGGLVQPFEIARTGAELTVGMTATSAVPELAAWHLDAIGRSAEQTGLVEYLGATLDLQGGGELRFRVRRNPFPWVVFMMGLAASSAGYFAIDRVTEAAADRVLGPPTASGSTGATVIGIGALALVAVGGLAALLFSRR